MATRSLAPIEPTYLRDEAFRQLRTAIVSGSLAPGEPLVIDQLATSFGLSSMPVREAVKRLVADGLVEELPRRAHRVALLTRASALDVLEIVGTLMIRAYEIGVPALEDDGIAAMRAAFDSACVCAAAGDLTGALAQIHVMHGVVYAASGNPEFQRTIGAIGPRFDRVLYLWYTSSISAVATSYRRDLVDAVEARRPEAAVAIMRDAWRRLRDVIASRQDDDL
jgi:DNA-binding GntR family transcriptional regulator